MGDFACFFLYRQLDRGSLRAVYSQALTQLEEEVVWRDRASFDYSVCERMLDSPAPTTRPTY